MHRIDGPGATVDNKFTDGDPVGGVQATLVTDDWLNDMQEEVMSVLAAAGITPVKGTQNQLLGAIKVLGRQAAILADTGTAGAYAAANSPALASLPSSGYIQRINIANANPGAATYAPDGLVAKPIYGLGLQPLQGGELPIGIAVLMYIVQAGVNGGNGAWVIIESLGGAAQVATATKSQHAIQLGQVQSLITNMQVIVSSGAFTVPANVTKLKYRAVGPGAGAGGSNAANSAAGGAGSGSYSEGVLAVTPGASLTITLGAFGAQGTTGNGNAGGTTTIVGTGISVSVFTGGPSLGANGAIPIGGQGPGGSVPVTSGANVLAALNVQGSPGQAAFYGGGSGYFSGNGGSSVFGGGLPGGGGYPGGAFGAYGAGGAGGANSNFGGNGSPSVVILEW